MAEGTENNQNNKSNNRLGILIGFIVLLLLINAAWFYFYNEKQGVVEEQTMTIAEQDSTIDLQTSQLDSLESELTNTLEQVRNLEGDTTELKKMLADIRADKERLQSQVNAYKWKASQYSKMKTQVALYKKQLAEAKTTIDSLEKANKELFAENTGLKEDKQNLKKNIDSLNSENTDLSSKVETAKRLKIGDIRIAAINRWGNLKIDEELRSRWVKKLRIDYKIAENKLAEAGNREIFLRIVNPDGEVLKDLATGGGSFEANGKDMFYTMKDDFMYDGNSDPEPFIYEPEDKIEDGDYMVEIYANGNLMGKKKFTVR